MKSAPLFALAIVAFVCTGLVSLAGENPQVLSAAEAVPRALQYLTEKGNDWMDDRQCASCHHLPMMIWSLREARANGFDIDEKSFAKAVDWSFSPKRDSDTFSDPTDKDAGGDYVREAAALLALSTAGTGQTPSAWSAKMVANAVRFQNAAGGWTQFPRNTRPPISPGVGPDLTLFVTAALAVQPSSKNDPITGVVLERALHYVESEPAGEETQPHALRLLLDAALSRKPDESAISWLRNHQQPDGGWSQLPETPSDAYATGQAIFSLRVAGVPAADLAIQRACDFLIKTQTADGSWRITSRPTAKSKTGSKNLEPITYSSTAWAVMALARSGTPPQASR